MSVCLPLFLYVVLRPENYGLTPNSLDPVFYSGYAINFDDLLSAVGDRHYFVSRWSAYLPAHIATILAGPIAGRLLWRLLLASLILAAIWSLGRRWKWNVATQLFVGTIIITTPMFLRAFFTDYVEYFAVSFGIVLVCLCLREIERYHTAALVGLLASLIVIANPISITAVAPCVVVGLILSRGSFVHRLGLTACIGVMFVATGLFGMYLFRYRYHIDNVYKPSWDFINHYKTPKVDDWRSPKLDWLGRYTWLYAPPLVALGGPILACLFKEQLTRVERIAFALCGFQYLYQWFDQFVRRGFGLELSYYWSFSLPSFLVALALLLGRLASRLSGRMVGMLATLWVLFLIIGVPPSLRLPPGLGFALILVVTVVGILMAARKSRATAGALLLAFVGWTQIGAPSYDPLKYMILNNSPQYQNLIRKGGDLSELVYREAVWFSRRMDKIPDDPNTSFVMAGGWASSISGIYAPHVVGRVITVDPTTLKLSDSVIHEVRSGFRPLLAVYGPPESVGAILANLPKDLGIVRKLADESHTMGLGYRLTVFEMPSNRKFPFSWDAHWLPATVPTRANQPVMASAGVTPGFITFGPYVTLPEGTYEAVLSYRSAGSESLEVGGFDVSSPETGVASAKALFGTDDKPSTKAIIFRVTKNQSTHRWEFRSIWNGASNITVESVTLLRRS